MALSGSYCGEDGAVHNMQAAEIRPNEGLPITFCEGFARKHFPVEPKVSEQPPRILMLYSKGIQGLYDGCPCSGSGLS